MRFTQTLTTLLLGATFTSLVAASPVNKTLVRRDQNLDDDIEADDETWARYTAWCGSTVSKRGLETRANKPSWIHNEVAMGNAAEMSGIPIGLWTQGLVTCLGVGAIGTKKEGGATYRALAHFTADKFSKESQWTRFKSMVENANLENVRTFLSVPDRENGVPDGWTDADKELAEEIESELKDRMDSLADGDAVKVVRQMKPAQERQGEAGSMGIDPSNVVYIEGNVVS